MNYESTLVGTIDLIKKKEGLRLKAYLCPAGKWTNGYGETEDVKEGDIWTKEKAETRVTARAKEFLDGVLKACPQLKSEPDNRVIACVSLAYNIGIGAFRTSSVCRLTSQKKYVQAADAFLLWNKVKQNGKYVISNGLVNRRKEERELYLVG